MNLMKMLAGAATPAMIGKVAGMLGVSSPAVQKMLSVAVPVVLSGLLGSAKKPAGREAFGKALGQVGDNPLDNLAAELDRDPAALSQGGSDFLSSMLGGDAVGALASKLGDFGEIPQDKSSSLLGLAGSLALGGLGTAAKDQNLDADGVLKYLDSQKSEIADAIPGDVRSALGGTDILSALDLGQAADAVKSAATQATSAATSAAASATATAASAASAAAAPAKKSGLMRWILIALAALIVLWLLSSLLGGSPEEEAPADTGSIESSLVVASL